LTWANSSRGKHLDEQGRALLLEDLRSPCTEEVAVFHAFSSVVNEARSAFVVLDTAPTGHSLLLMDATGAYHRQMMSQHGGEANARGITTPLMRLQDAELTRVIIVTLPEVTPVSQAAALQDDLRRAKIEPWAWVINKSLAASGTSDPLLGARIAAERRQIERIAAGLARRTCVLPWLPEPPVGIAAPSSSSSPPSSSKAANARAHTRAALPTTPGRTRPAAASPDKLAPAMDGAARLTSERPSHKRGALVVLAVSADFAWVAVHVRALTVIGLADGDAGFYVTYQIGRCAIAAVAVGVALRSGLFGRRELGLVGARQGAALCRLSRFVGIVALLGAVLVCAALLVAPSATCELARRELSPVVYPWEMFVRHLLCMVAVAPVYEEFMYRALLLSALRDRLGEQPALFVGGAVFVVLHYAYGYGWQLGYLAAALVFGLVFLRTRSIVAAVALHALNNLWVVLNWQVRATYDDAAILGWLCSR
jgi:membrane protease YdiL (CAAX protease family)